MEYLKSWFRGFEQGIADLQPQQREVLFRACAVNCVHGGPFGLYRSLFEAAEGDLDRFFVKIDELDGVRGEIVCAGREYNLCFEACSCALHRAGKPYFVYKKRVALYSRKRQPKFSKIKRCKLRLYVIINFLPEIFDSFSTGLSCKLLHFGILE